MRGTWYDGQSGATEFPSCGNNTSYIGKAIVMYRHYSLCPLTSSDIVEDGGTDGGYIEATRAITAHAFMTSDTADRHA